MKYVSTQITFQEIPGLVTRCFSISNCGGTCAGCHSPELQEDRGEELTVDIIDKYLKEDKDTVDCYVFLGDGRDCTEMIKILTHCKNNNMKTCLYLGHNNVFPVYFIYLDYIKVGCYRQDLGGLNSPTTNQRMFKNITSEFYNPQK